MKKLLKRIAIIVGILFALLIALGIYIDATSTPEEKAARKAKIEADRAAAEAKKAQEQAEKEAKEKAEAEAKAQAEAEKQAEKEAKEKAEAEAKAQAEAEKSAQERAEKLKRIEIELMTLCQMDIQKDLHNEKSMEIDHWTFKSWETDEGRYRVGFKFNASNLYGAAITHTAVCEFDQDKNLLRREVA